MKIVVTVESSIKLASHNSFNEISVPPQYTAFAAVNNAYPSVEIPVKSRLLKLIEYPVITLRDRFHKNSSVDSKKAAATNLLRLQEGFFRINTLHLQQSIAAGIFEIVQYVVPLFGS